jgi:hypothetical protein
LIKNEQFGIELLQPHDGSLVEEIDFLERLPRHGTLLEIPIVDDVGWDDAVIHPVTGLAVVETAVVALAGLNEALLVEEEDVAFGTAVFLKCQTHLRADAIFWNSLLGDDMRDANPLHVIHTATVSGVEAVNADVILLKGSDE